MSKMRLVTKRDGKYVWVALKDKEGYYHCWLDDCCRTKSLIVAGILYSRDEVDSIRQLLTEEGTI